MKRTLLILGAVTTLAGSATAQVNELMRHERMSETEAASVVAIARGLGLRLDYVVWVDRELKGKPWELGPVFYISERNNLDPIRVWQEHRRGVGWMEIVRGRNNYGYGMPPRGGYGEGHRGFGDNHGDSPDRYGDRYDDDYSNRRGGLAGPIDEVLGRRDDDAYYRDNRSRYGRNSDGAYEERVWDQLLQRAYGQDASKLWRYLDRGTHIGDLALASHLAKVVRTRPERVMDELLRTHDWNRVREIFGVSRDWETRGRYWNDRGRTRDRSVWDDLIEIFR